VKLGYGLDHSIRKVDADKKRVEVLEKEEKEHKLIKKQIKGT
jgi:hypothetical protein